MEAFAARSCESGKRRRLSARCGGILGNQFIARGGGRSGRRGGKHLRDRRGQLRDCWMGMVKPSVVDMPPLCPAVAERLLKRVFMLRSAIPA
jgi:hypothetical protein